MNGYIPEGNYVAKPSASPPGRLCRLFGAETLAVNSQVTQTKFAKFLSDVEGSTTVLSRSLALQSFHPLWNSPRKD